MKIEFPTETTLSSLELNLHEYTEGAPFKSVESDDPEIVRWGLKPAHDSMMISATQVGVYVGEDAVQKSTDEAQIEADLQGVVNPIHAKAPYGIATKGPIELIKRVRSEPRGIFFAKVAGAVLHSTIEAQNKDSTEEATALSMWLGFQLLFEPRHFTKNGEELVSGTLLPNKIIADEIDLLKRVLESEDASGLSHEEFVCLDMILGSAENMHKSLRDSAQEVNIHAVENTLDFKKRYHRKGRIAKRAGAVLCGAISIGSAYAISPMLLETTSTEVRVNTYEHAQDLAAVMRLQDNSNSDVEISQIAEVTLQETSNDVAELEQTKLNKDDRRVLSELEDSVVLINQYIAAAESGDSKTAEKLYHQITGDLKLLITETERGPDKFYAYSLMAMMIIGYGSFAGGFLASASKKGGRRDPLRLKTLPELKAGKIIQLPWQVNLRDRVVMAYNKANKD